MCLSKLQRPPGQHPWAVGVADARSDHHCHVQETPRQHHSDRGAHQAYSLRRTDRNKGTAQTVTRCCSRLLRRTCDAAPLAPLASAQPQLPYCLGTNPPWRARMQTSAGPHVRHARPVLAIRYLSILIDSAGRRWSAGLLRQSLVCQQLARRKGAPSALGCCSHAFLELLPLYRSLARHPARLRHLNL